MQLIPSQPEPAGAFLHEHGDDKRWEAADQRLAALVAENEREFGRVAEDELEAARAQIAAWKL